MNIPSGFKQDLQNPAPYKKRVYLEPFAQFDPLSFPWKEWRKYPENFPSHHVAKVSSVRTVVGMDYTTSEGKVERLYLKRSYVAPKVGKIILSLFRASKEWKELLLANKFSRAGVVVPEPVYYGEAVESSGRSVVFFATRALSRDWQEGRDFFQQEKRFEGEWESLARYTKWLHDKGILHADYRGDHLWFNKQAFADGVEPQWALIDLDGSWVGKSVTRTQRHRALYQLAESLIRAGLTEGDMADFLRLYDPEAHFAFSGKEIFDLARERDEVALHRKSFEK